MLLIVCFLAYAFTYSYVKTYHDIKGELSAHLGYEPRMLLVHLVTITTLLILYAGYKTAKKTARALFT